MKKNVFEEEYDSKTLDECKPVVEDTEMKYLMRLK
jgi:hypothetical protein